MGDGMCAIVSQCECGPTSSTRACTFLCVCVCVYARVLVYVFVYLLMRVCKCVLVMAPAAIFNGGEDLRAQDSTPILYRP